MERRTPSLLHTQRQRVAIRGTHRGGPCLPIGFTLFSYIYMYQSLDQSVCETYRKRISEATRYDHHEYER